MGQFNELFEQSIEKPEEFWANAAEGIDWIKKWDKVLDASNPPSYRWFKGAELNTCYNAVDRHVEAGRGEQTAIIYDSPVTDTIRKISYKELQHDVAQFAGALKSQGVTKGDTVIIYMPMIPEAVFAMLACAR
ncbi:MAG: AMP-binding protein, partial [Desulfocapsa sp.]|nr:AMP-binding protein [Desulfocapsa sp.]